MKPAGFLVVVVSVLIAALGTVQVSGDLFANWLSTQNNWTSIEKGLLANLPASAATAAPGNPELVKFYLYTDNSSRFDPDELVYNNASTLTASRLNSSNIVRFFIHGFGHGYNCSYAQDIKDIYLANGFNLNIVIVDWRALAGDFTISADSIPDLLTSSQALLSYYQSVKNTAVVGQRVGDMIKFLVDEGAISLENIHVVGFSLGAQVAGYAGSRVISVLNTKLPRITGLDPAGPLYQTGLIGVSLNSSDAVFVDFYHTDMGQSGTPQSLGHYNFFINRGIAPQPSCTEYYVGSSSVSILVGKLPYAVTGSCSHDTAPLYYAQSILRNNIGVNECPSGNDVLIQTGTLYCPPKPKSSVVFGENCKRIASPAKTTGFYLVQLQPVQASGIYSC